MCGICGYLQTGPSPVSTDPTLTDRMTDVLAHRGPDWRGTWSNGPIALGHRRLSIIDLSKHGAQPMANEDGSIQIVYNGEVYNFRELKQRFALVERGHVFRSRTDTEVLVHLYEELGEQMIAELNGMFAFAVWDARQGKLLLARDRYGIKPLFYTWHGSRFLFASEIKSLLQDPQVPRRPDLQALHDYLTFDYVPGEQTAFEGIREVPPAHSMTLAPEGEARLRRYWEPDFDVDVSLDETKAVAGARQLMEEAVQRQLVADVPVGVLLSGGLDSSAIVAFMRRHTTEPIHTFSVGFEDPSFNELPYARIVARQFDTVQHEICVTPSLVRELLPRCISFIDEPYADGSAIPTWCVCQMARKDVTVVLSGEGGDEVFAGYETYAAFNASQWFRRVPRWVRQSLIAPLVNCLPVSNKKLSLEFKLKRFLGGQDLPPAEAHLWWRVVLSETEKLELYTPEVLEQMVPQRSDRHFTNVYNRSSAKDTLNRLLHIDQSVFLPDDLMIKNDRMSMAHSLEARVPLTDNDLTGFMARVSPRLKLRGLRKKYLMRRALKEILPAKILNKKKVGLEMPYSRWLKHELSDVLQNYCGRDQLAQTGLFRPAGVQRLIEEHKSNRRDHGRALWGLLNYMVWHEQYVA